MNRIICLKYNRDVIKLIEAVNLSGTDNSLPEQLSRAPAKAPQQPTGLAKDLRALLALDLQGGEDPSALTSPPHLMVSADGVVRSVRSSF
jgi:hypothetical protein